MPEEEKEQSTQTKRSESDSSLEKKPKKGLVKAHEFYEKKGESLERKNKICPKCGPGYFLAKHGNRLHCGHCSYTEFISKRSEEKKK